MAPKVGAPVVAKPPEAATITPIELACLVQQYLMENRFPKALQEFQTEAGHLLSTVRTPKSMRSLTVILSEYINLKAFEARAAAEKAKTDQLLRSLYGVLEDFRPGSSKDYAASPCREVDKKALSQQALGKENARQGKGRKNRKSGASNETAPPSAEPAPYVNSQPPTFTQRNQVWPQAGQGANFHPPAAPFEVPPDSSPGDPGTAFLPPGLSQPAPNVNRPRANGSGHSPGGWPGLDPPLSFSASSLQQPPQNQGPGHSPSTFQPGSSQSAPQGALPGFAPPALNSRQPGAELGGASSPLLVGQHSQPEGDQEHSIAPPNGVSTSEPVRPDQLGSESAEANMVEPGSPVRGKSCGGDTMMASPSWCLESPGKAPHNDNPVRGANVPLEAGEMSTPSKAPKSGSAAQVLTSPLRSPHTGRKGTPRKRNMVDPKGVGPNPKRVSPNRALFGGQPAARPEKTPKKALFADNPAKASQDTNGGMSDAGLLDHLELPGEEPMGEADFRALVVDTFSKDLDLPTRIAGHITHVMKGGGQDGREVDPLEGLDIPSDATYWAASDGDGLGDALFSNDDIPVDDILAAITADPHVSQLLESLAATPVSLSGFDDFVADENQ